MKTTEALLRVSLHGIQWQAPIGLYPEEKQTGNAFELDLDIDVPTAMPGPLPFLDYARIRQWVDQVLEKPGELLETYVQALAETLRKNIPHACRLQIRLRKYHPPFPGETRYAQVSLDWPCGPADGEKPEYRAAEFP